MVYSVEEPVVSERAVVATPDSALRADLRTPGESRYYRRVVGNDLDEALAFFTPGYDLRSPQLRRTGPSSRWDFAGVGDERISMRSSHLGADLRSSSRNDDDVIVAWIRGGRSTIQHAGTSTTLRRGVPVVLPFGEHYDLHHLDIAISLVQIDRSFVAGIAGDDDFAFDPVREPDPAGLRRWTDVVRRLTPRFLDVRNGMTDIERRDIAEELARTAISAFPRQHAWSSVIRGTGPEHDRVRRAIEYVHAHAKDAIGTTEIAEAAGLSARGLQQSLRRHLDLTPGDFLRSVRLDGAHGDLRRAERAVTSVADIARAWGFGHLGRFSASYRERFGVLPSETLRGRG